MQKVLNVLTIISFATICVGTAAGVHVYMNRESIVENAKDQIKSMVLESVTGELDIPGADILDPKKSTGLPVPIPVVPF